MKFDVGFCVLALCLCASTNAWSWEDSPKEDTKVEEVVEVEEAPIQETKTSTKRETNATEIEQVIESILNSGRQGRNIKGYDEIYTDPSVQEILQKDVSSDDPEARNIIKDRLCSLGLMQCDEALSEKRPYISPEELVYAQPVDIKPIGRPIPSIAVKGPSRAIYSSRPGYPSKNGPPPPYGPPRPGYGPPQSLPNRPPQGFPVPPKRYNPGAPPKPYGPPGPVFSSAPIEVDNPPFEFDSSSFIQKQEIKKKYETHIGPNGEPQQHVHHHYHHNADANLANSKVPTIVVNNPPQIFKPSEQISTTAFLKEDYKGTYGGQSIANYNGLGNYAGTKPVVEYPDQYKQGPQTFGGTGQSLYTQTSLGSSSNSYGQGNFGAGSNYGSASNSFNQGSQGNFGSTGNYGSQGNFASSSSGFGGNGLSNSFGASVGSYGSSDFYKKELTVGGNLNNLGGNGYDKYQGLSSENYDCICVPYDQCPNQDVIGRKDDLYLPLDPRNLKSDIQAEEERVITDGNGTMTTIKVKKDTGLNVTEEAVTESSKKTKREATTETSTEKAKVEAVSNQNHYFKTIKYHDYKVVTCKSIIIKCVKCVDNSLTN